MSIHPREQANSTEKAGIPEGSSAFDFSQRVLRRVPGRWRGHSSLVVLAEAGPAAFCRNMQKPLKLKLPLSYRLRLSLLHFPQKLAAAEGGRGSDKNISAPLTPNSRISPGVNLQ
jgi:hypothetical protein